MQVGRPVPCFNILEEGKHPAPDETLPEALSPPVPTAFAGVRTRPRHERLLPLLAGRPGLPGVRKSPAGWKSADHWIVYCTVQDGKVSDPDGITAVHHRKVGNYY